jgi:hypothetical protein
VGQVLAFFLLLGANLVKNKQKSEENAIKMYFFISFFTISIAF